MGIKKLFLVKVTFPKSASSGPYCKHSDIIIYKATIVQKILNLMSFLTRFVNLLNTKLAKTLFIGQYDANIVIYLATGCHPLE